MHLKGASYLFAGFPGARRHCDSCIHHRRLKQPISLNVNSVLAPFRHLHLHVVPWLMTTPHMHGVDTLCCAHGMSLQERVSLCILNFHDAAIAI